MKPMAGKRYVVFHCAPTDREYYVFDRLTRTVEAGPLPVVQAVQERDRLNAASPRGEEGAGDGQR